MSTTEDILRIKVRSAMKHSQVSQAALSRRLGVSYGHLNQMLRGERTLGLGWAEQILAECGMHLVVDVRHNRTQESHL